MEIHEKRVERIRYILTDYNKPFFRAEFVTSILLASNAFVFALLFYVTKDTPQEWRQRLDWAFFLPLFTVAVTMVFGFINFRRQKNSEILARKIVYRGANVDCFIRKYGGENFVPMIGAVLSSGKGTFYIVLKINGRDEVFIAQNKRFTDLHVLALYSLINES